MYFHQVEAVVGRSRIMNWSDDGFASQCHLFTAGQVATSCVLILQGYVEVVSGKDGEATVVKQGGIAPVSRALS